MIRTLIVDDVDLARENIRIRLQKHKDVTVVGEAATSRDAFAAISRLSPDLIFLDIQMPDSDGFKILKNMRQSPPPAVIFVTAHDEYAVRAFVANAEHYLLKPIDDDQFEEALQRARHSLSMRPQMQQNVPSLPDQEVYRRSLGVRDYLDRIAIKDRDNFRMLKTSSIDWIESDGNYIRLHSQGHPYTVRTVLKEVEERLNPAQFARISRSIVINLDSVVEIKKLWHGDFEVLLADRARVRLSRRYRSRVLPSQV
jgi:two-component system, LytTR family, response regulator